MTMENGLGLFLGYVWPRAYSGGAFGDVFIDGLGDSQEADTRAGEDAIMDGSIKNAEGGFSSYIQIEKMKSQRL